MKIKRAHLSKIRIKSIDQFAEYMVQLEYISSRSKNDRMSHQRGRNRIVLDGERWGKQ